MSKHPASVLGVNETNTKDAVTSTQKLEGVGQDKRQSTRRSSIDMLTQKLEAHQEKQQPTQRKLIGLLGAPIKDSPFPAMIVKEFAEVGVSAWCQTLDLGDLALQGRSKDIIEGAKLAGYDGFAVTMPSKEDALSACDDLSPECVAIGAVNCIAIDSERRATGYNLDMIAAKLTMEEQLGAEGKIGAVGVIGAGGVARAVVYALFKMGARRVVLTDLDTSKVDKLIKDLGPHVGSMTIEAAPPGACPLGVEGVVNCSPVGMPSGPQGMPVPEQDLKAPDIKWVFDVIVEETEFLKVAEANGKLIIRGGRMVVVCMQKIFDVLSGGPV